MIEMPEKRSLCKTEVLLFCILAGVLATFSRVYVIGGPYQEDQLDLLPILFRALDPGYLRGDFYLNSVAGVVGPRYYYTQALAALATCIPVPLLLLLLTMAAHGLLARVTFQVARTMHAGSDLAAILAVGLTLSVNSFDLGRASQLASSELKPSFLVMAIGLGSLWLGLNGRLLGCTVLGAIALPIHPLIGLEMPAIGLAARALEVVFFGGENAHWGSRLRRLAGIAASLGTLILVAYACFHSQPASSISTARFIEILAQCRAPHHYLPSTFGRQAYACTGAFLLAMGLCWRFWRQTAAAGPLPRRVLIANGVVIGLLICGYVFAELIPVRAAVTAQTFRMASVMKWFGFILFAGMAAQLIVRRSFLGAAPGWCMLMGIGPLQPLAVLLGQSLYMARGWLTTTAGRTVLSLLSGLAMVAIVSFGVDGLWVEAMGLVLVAGLGFWYLLGDGSWQRRLTPVVAIFILSCLLVSQRTPGFEIPGVLIRPMVHIDDLRNPCLGIGLFARQNTPADSLFIVPPDLGNFQLVAQRAVVVQWKAFPFSDAAMEQWYERMRDCYGDSAETKVPVKEVLAERYRSISREQLLRAGKKYGATHAVLYKNTCCDLPVLFADETYKIVKLSEAATPAKAAR
jgi:hypothetical protein